MAVAVRCGLVDPNDPPTPHMPLLAACPRCEQKDPKCPSCGGRGTFRIEADPRDTIPAAAYQVAEMAGLWVDQGIPTVAGGQLDQSAWFNDAALFCVADRDRILARRYGTT